MSDKEALNQLLWFANRGERHTYLLVHNCELDVYQHHLKDILNEQEIGIASWECGTAVGFGLSRRAAQALSMKERPSYELVMCDANVQNNSKLRDGYATDDDEHIRRSLNETNMFAAHLSTPGLGAGTPTAKWDKKVRTAKGKKGRTFEQVVRCDTCRFYYDPAFVTSNEDIAMAEIHHVYGDLLAQREVISGATRLKKGGGSIHKFPNFRLLSGNPEALTTKYVDMRRLYLLNDLAAEGDTPILYKWRRDADSPFENFQMTLNSLAQYLQTIHPSADSYVLRSIIFEIILVKWLAGSMDDCKLPLYASIPPFKSNSLESFNASSISAAAADYSSDLNVGVAEESEQKTPEAELALLHQRHETTQKPDESMKEVLD